MKKENALEENGINVHVMPQVSKTGPMVKALDEYVSTSNSATYRKLTVRWKRVVLDNKHTKGIVGNYYF